MKELHIDIETYSSADLAKCGVYKYTECRRLPVTLYPLGTTSVWREAAKRDIGRTGG